MSTITAGYILTRATNILQDSTNVRWPEDELIDYLNDGQRQIVLFRPDASVKNEAVQLTAGETKQSIPDAGIRFLNPVRNMGVGGATPGEAIRIVDRDVLDTQRPDWHSRANSYGFIKHIVYDDLDPKTFYVFPKAPATAWYIDVVYSVAPTDCADSDAVISIDDVYANALLDYILYRAFSKDAEYAANQGSAAGYFNSFQNALGIKTKVDGATSPNENAPPRVKRAQ